MFNSRSIDDLRADVAANCRIFMTLCKAAGLPVLITGTVRDDEYQQLCYKNGASKTAVPSFHSVKAGLAFDICKNVKEQEYSDAAFFARCGAIGKSMGFEWGGDWKSFVDKPHFQWSGLDHEYTSKDIIAGRYPPTMPLYETEEDKMTGEQIYKALTDYMATLPTSDYAKEASAKGIAAGVFSDGDSDGLVDNPQGILRRQELAVVLDRLGLLDK